MTLLLALFILAASPTPTPAADPSILGAWESIVLTRGGIGNVLEFFSDGRVTQTSAAIANADYELQGEWLRTFWRDPSGGKVSEVDTRIELQGGDRLCEKSAEGTGETCSERMGEARASATPLVGQWCGRYLETLISYREFTANKMFVRTPLRTLRGRYSVSDHTMNVEIVGQPPGKYPFRIENGELIITNLEGAQKQYRRTECTLLRDH